MNISGSNTALFGLSAYSTNRSSISNASAFSDALTDVSRSSSPAVTVSISPQALAASANLSTTSVQSQGSTAPVLNQAFFDRAASVSVTDRNAMYRSAASAISASQGLPDGKYDFTKLSDAQASVVANDLILNQGKTDIGDLNIQALGPSGFDDPATQQPRDRIQKTNNAIQFEVASGYSSAARLHQLSLDLMKQLSV